MCFSCRPSSTSSVFIRKYTSFFVRKCGRWTFWTCGMWSPIRLKKYVIQAFASATLVASVRLTPFLLNSISPSRNWWSNFWYFFLEIPRTDMNVSRQISCPSSITAEFWERLFSPSDLEGIKDELVLLGSCSWLKFLPGMLHLNNAEMGQTSTSTAAVA